MLRDALDAQQRLVEVRFGEEVVVDFLQFADVSTVGRSRGGEKQDTHLQRLNLPIDPRDIIRLPFLLCRLAPPAQLLPLEAARHLQRFGEGFLAQVDLGRELFALLGGCAWRGGVRAGVGIGIGVVRSGARVALAFGHGGVCVAVGLRTGLEEVFAGMRVEIEGRYGKGTRSLGGCVRFVRLRAAVLDCAGKFWAGASRGAGI